MRVTKLDAQIKQWANMTDGAEAMDGISEDREKYDEIMGTLQKVQMDEDYQMTLAWAYSQAYWKTGEIVPYWKSN